MNTDKVKFSHWFITKERDNGDLFVTLVDNTPAWLKGAVREAHCGDLPNDWIYNECKAAVNAIDEGYLSEDNENEHINSRLDIYSKDLMQWASEFITTDTWANSEQEAEDCGYSKDATIIDRIRSVQYFAIEYITRVMLNAVNIHKNDSE